MIPFAPPASFYRFCPGNFSIPSPEGMGKALARTLIAGDVMLSVPVEGGASRLKHRGVRDVEISQHGRWQDVHLGALRAAYGRTPYFAHLFPQIERVYEERSHGPLCGFNTVLHELALSWLDLDSRAGDDLMRMFLTNRLRAMQIAEEVKRNINMDYSIFDALFRLGRETLFGLALTDEI